MKKSLLHCIYGGTWSVLRHWKVRGRADGITAVQLRENIQGNILIFWYVVFLHTVHGLLYWSYHRTEFWDEKYSVFV